jgi:thioesterase domain-containing protein
VDPLARLLERAVAEGVLPAELPAAELERRFALFVHHDSLLRLYRPGPYAGSPVLLLASASGSPDRERAWRRWIADITVESLAAGHYELLREPAVRGVAERLQRRLAAGG